MNVASPHYLLFPDVADEAQQGRWRFVLRAVDGSFRLDAEDVEPQTVGERLELLAVVRGLEALDQPSRVTLITTSKYVREGIRHGVMEWRENDWRWERFGQMVPVKNQDLWQRVDRAMRFHKIDCRILRFDSPHCEVTTERDVQDRETASRKTVDRPDFGANGGKTAAAVGLANRAVHTAGHAGSGAQSRRRGTKQRAERFASIVRDRLTAGLRGLWLRATL
jgi:ribonuclease HI